MGFDYISSLADDGKLAVVSAPPRVQQHSGITYKTGLEQQSSGLVQIFSYKQLFMEKIFSLSIYSEAKGSCLLAKCQVKDSRGLY